MNFLFWNTHGKAVNEVLFHLIKSEAIDIVILAEFNQDGHGLLRSLDKEGLYFYEIPQIACKKIHIFSKFQPGCFKPGLDSGRYTVRELRRPGADSLLMILVHFPSKLHMADERDQLQFSSVFKQDVEEAEKQHNCKNTIIIGDFNMNPFEPGMISANAMHSISCADTAGREEREIQGRMFSMFYNPMWNLFGDNDDKPGTHFYQKSTYNVYFWNIYDQVILRPALLDKFERRSLRIITEVNDAQSDIKLVNEKNRPMISDHLPIAFTLNMKGGSE